MAKEFLWHVVIARPRADSLMVDAANESCPSRSRPILDYIASSDAGRRALATIAVSQHVKLNQMWCPGGPTPLPLLVHPT